VPVARVLSLVKGAHIVNWPWGHQITRRPNCVDEHTRCVGSDIDAFPCDPETEVHTD